MACLAKHPSERPASAEMVGDELAAIAADLPPWTRDRAERWWRTHVPLVFSGSPAAASAHDTGASTVINV
jgi:hypothetical protein